ncbi:MAG: hypothetical protein IT379_10580 [Deltaproteobacteria bacterium]|nr:hypothetical protein [Deltaproteobacteria bacterium]
MRRSAVIAEPPDAPRARRRTLARADASDDRSIVRILASRKRVLAALLVVAIAITATKMASRSANAGNHSASLALALRDEGLRVQANAVAWLGADEGPLRPRAALVLASRSADEPRDVYYVEARPLRSGGVFDVSSISNLTRSSGSDETLLAVVPPFAAFATRTAVEGGGHSYDAVVVLDVSGEPASLTSDFSWRERVQSSITNYQETGRFGGIGRVRYDLARPAARMSIGIENRQFVIRADDRTLIVDPTRVAPIAGASELTPEPQTKGRSSLIHWAVDTARASPLIGAHGIEWMEDRFFRVKDRAEQTYHSVVGTSAADTEAEVAEDMGLDATHAPAASLSATDPELGWPPAPLRPILPNPTAREGEWTPLVDDPFVQESPGAPPGLFQTFLRADAARPYAIVYATMWDPRQVRLHVVMGTREPRSATGQTGTGMIPRDEETMRTVVAAFNGGFQAVHGEFGMMADGTLYLPPKPWASTVGIFDDGRVGLGTWPGPVRQGAGAGGRADWAHLPEGMVGMRQNLTAVVEDGVWNPYHRYWWGSAIGVAGVADGDPRPNESIVTHRSAVCLTREGFVGYFWGSGLTAEALAAGMNAARCVHAMHLDINPGHCSMELYRAGPTPSLPHVRIDERTQFETTLDGLAGWTVRGRKAIRAMSSIRWPRYIRRDARDFFYLTLRPVLPGPPLPDGTGEWSTRALPHAGWPHAFARATIAIDGRTVWLVRIDASRALPSVAARADTTRALAYLADAASLPSGAGGQVIFVGPGRNGLRAYDRAVEGGTRVAGGPALGADPAGAALGVDPRGFLVYAEVQGQPDAGLLSRVMALAEVRSAIALDATTRLAFVDSATRQTVAVDGEHARVVELPRAMALLADERPAAERLFPFVEPVALSVWHGVQGRRVRYFREPRTPSPAASPAGAAPSPSGSAPAPAPRVEPGSTVGDGEP